MKRWSLAIVFSLIALVALAFATEDLCDGFVVGRILAILTAGASIGALVGTLLPRRVRTNMALPWIVGVVTWIAASGALYTALLIWWAGECSR